MIDKIFYLIFFILILALSRLIPHPANFTPIIASAIMAPMLIKSRTFGLLIPLIAMILTDIVIGFHSYQFVIYLTIITIGLITTMKNNFVNLMLFSFLSSLWFFIITNFAVWIVWDYYPKTFEGLILCYTLAIPFFTNTLISTCLFVGLFSLINNKLERLNDKIKSYILSNYNII